MTFDLIRFYTNYQNANSQADKKKKRGGKTGRKKRGEKTIGSG